jgi:uncharacterized protein (TIGR03437 family)
VPVAAAQTEGPYWVEEKLQRSDIRVDPSDGSTKPGILLALTINVQEVSSAGCTLLAGAQVDIWHCDAAGLYSDTAANNTVGKKFLRGYQITDDGGTVRFTTIYPGWYSGRTVHIHVRVRTYSGTQQLDEFTAQLFFDDSITDQVFTQAPYNSRGTRNTRNANDMVRVQTGSGTVLNLAVTQTAAGYAGSVDIGVNLKTAAASKPAIASSGVVSAASFKAGIAPGSWVTIFGQNLAAATRSLSGSDLVNGHLPTTLGGVSVQIDNQAAFPSYISAAQINVQAPSSNNTGTVNVTVTNSGGTSDVAAATMQTFLPAFFTNGNYVAAVRLDGTIITGTSTGGSGTTAAAKPGEVVQLFGTGFGPTTPAIAPGTVPQVRR